MFVKLRKVARSKGKKLKEFFKSMEKDRQQREQKEKLGEFLKTTITGSKDSYL